MTPFEYITVLISIVLGLGITQIVTGVADIIHQWSRVKLYWPHLLWIVFVFFLHVQEWWWFYELREHRTWELPMFLFVLLYPINLFILARILFPSATETGNMKEFYFGNYRKFFLLFAILALLAVLDDVSIQHYALIDEIPQIALLVMSVAITLRRITNEVVHKVLAGVIMVVIVLMGVSGFYTKLE
jgi:hypothetical protein